MNTQDILADTRVRQLQSDYAMKGIPFQPHLDEAIDKATEGIEDPELREVTRKVIKYLEQQLERCIMAKLEAEAKETGTTWLGRTWRKLWNRFIS